MIKGLPIGDNFPCFIIAEIGQNHGGDVQMAKELILKAKECGANCVKFQKTSLPHKFTQSALDKPYNSQHSYGATYGEHKARLELSHQDFKVLQEFAEKVGLLFTASAMDEVSADFLISLDVPFIKIGSGDTNNFPLIEHVARTRKPIILSTGMQDLETVEFAVESILKYHSDLVLLHCVSSYPTPASQVNLRVMDLYRKKFPGVILGYSGHELGIYVPIAAVALGAKVIEKHFTLDKSLKGTDHQCSLDPSQFKEMVEGIREVEVAMGKEEKKIMLSEYPCHEKLGKSIVTSRKFSKGMTLTKEDLRVKVSHPRGIEPQLLYKIVGKRVKRNLEADVPITLEDLL